MAKRSLCSRDVHPLRAVHSDADGLSAEIVGFCTVLAPCTNELSARIKNLYTIVVGVYDVNDTAGQHSYTRRIVELAFAGPRVAPLAKKRTVGSELLDTTVAGIGHIHVARTVNTYAPRIVELTVSGSRQIRSANGAPAHDEPSVGRELLYTVVA